MILYHGYHCTLVFVFPTRDHLGRRDIVLNYRDIDGDLIEIVDQSDLDLMTKTTPLTLYITDQGDHTPYNTHPYR